MPCCAEKGTVDREILYSANNNQVNGGESMAILLSADFVQTSADLTTRTSSVARGADRAKVNHSASES